MDAPEGKKTIEVDGQIKEFDVEKTFGSISQEIKASLAPERVLTEILVDNKAVDLNEEEFLNRQFLKNIGKVVLRSRDVKELFRESLQLAPRICDAMEMDCRDIDSFLAANETTKAQERIGELTSLLEWLLQLLSGSHILGAEKVEEIKFSGGRAMETVNRMQFLLAKLHLHLANQKWDDFRTVLTGQFAAEVKIWKVMFTELSQNWSPNPNLRPSTRDS